MAQNKYTKSARGQNCTVRIPGCCNGNSETVVFAHLNGAGFGRKYEFNIPETDRSFPIGSYACSACHDVIDFRIKTEFDRDLILLWHHEAIIRTLGIMIKERTLLIKN